VTAALQSQGSSPPVPPWEWSQGGSPELPSPSAKHEYSALIHCRKTQDGHIPNLKGHWVTPRRKAVFIWQKAHVKHPTLPKNKRAYGRTCRQRHGWVALAGQGQAEMLVGQMLETGVHPGQKTGLAIGLPASACPECSWRGGENQE